MAKLKLPDPKAAERLAKVTGNPAPNAPPTKKVSGIPFFNDPPEGLSLRPGQVVQTSEEASRFTATEQAGLSEKGWTPQSDVKPEEVGDVIELLEAQAAMPPPELEPTRPKTEFEIKDYAKGTAEQRKSFDDAVLAVRAQREKDAEKAARTANLNPSVKAALDLANKVEVEDDLDEKAKAAFIQTPKVEDLPKKDVSTDSKVESTASTSETGAANPAPLICENCGHHSLMEPIRDLPMGDRENFLLSLMSGKAYRKAYLLYSGKVTVHYRTLNSNELDACFRAASYRLRLEQASGNMLDTLELTRRYRLCLQFQEMQVNLADSPLNVSTPEGLCKELSPGADEFWATESDGNIPATSPDRDKWLFELLERVYVYLQDNVIKQESLMRIIFKQMNQFNREVKWLEDRADDPAFLQPAEKQPS